MRNAALGLSALALTGALVAAPQLAQADPPLTVDEAKAQIAELETEAAAIDQEYVGVKQGLAQSAAQLKLKKADVKSQTTKVQRLRVQAGQVALAQFQNQHLDAAAKLLLSEDTDEFLSQISTVEKVSENQNSALQDYQEEQAKLTELERSTETETAQLKKEQAELDKLRISSDSKIAESKTVLAKLTEEERQRIAAEEQKAREEAQAAAEAMTGTSVHDHGHCRRWIGQGRSGSGLREVTARQALSVCLGRPERVRLLGADLGSLGQGGRLAAAHLADPDRRGSIGVEVRAAAGRPRLLLRRHQPRRPVRRQRADRPRARGRASPSSTPRSTRCRSPAPADRAERHTAPTGPVTGPFRHPADRVAALREPPERLLIHRPGGPHAADHLDVDRVPDSDRACPTARR